MSTQPYLFLNAGGGEKLAFLDDSELIIRTPGDETGAPAHYEYVAKPAAKGSPQHVHRRHDETFLVVEGQFEFTLGTTTVRADPGSFLLVRRGQPHGFRNSGAARGRIVGTFAPYFAQYFRELAQIIARTGAAPPLEDWVKLYGRYDTTFYDGPPPSPQGPQTQR
ncbi:MAG: cupin domain-containing protein [Planctomycetota bacterium]